MKYFFNILGALSLGFGFVLLVGWTTMTLWNLLIPTIFGLTAISFWQAMGLLLLSRILLGGFGGGGWRPAQWQRKKDHWKQKMQERWSEMSEEERNEWKSRLAKHCGGYPSKRSTDEENQDKEQ